MNENRLRLKLTTQFMRLQPSPEVVGFSSMKPHHRFIIVMISALSLMIVGMCLIIPGLGDTPFHCPEGKDGPCVAQLAYVVSGAILIAVGLLTCVCCGLCRGRSALKEAMNGPTSPAARYTADDGVVIPPLVRPRLAESTVTSELWRRGSDTHESRITGRVRAASPGVTPVRLPPDAPPPDYTTVMRSPASSPTRRSPHLSEVPPPVPTPPPVADGDDEGPPSYYAAVVEDQVPSYEEALLITGVITD